MKTTARLINRHHFVCIFELENNNLLLDYIDRNKSKNFDIDIKIHKEGRTLTQNGFFHLRFPLAASYNGL